MSKLTSLTTLLFRDYYFWDYFWDYFFKVFFLAGFDDFSYFEAGFDDFSYFGADFCDCVCFSPYQDPDFLDVVWLSLDVCEELDILALFFG